MGGYSSEYKISVTSGKVVINKNNNAKIKKKKNHTNKEKQVNVDENDAEFPIDKNDFSVTVNGSKINFDVVFNAIHGTPGEDGLMQAYF